ncbi:MAG TPA: uroporphyrinogen-III synthase [Verrucomicrobiae bacterium]|nr:uroporphyrinogen-III synthase [Verrucomicrobiae bacterium]
MNNINIAITKEDTDIKTDTFLQSSYYIGKKINLISLPTIITVPLYTEEIKKSLKKIEEGFYDYYIYLSANAVNIFFNKIKEEKTYSKIIENIQRINKDNFDSSIIAIGPKTKKEIEKYGLKANIAEFSNIQKKEDGYKRIGIYRKEVFQKEPDYSSKSIISFLDNLNNNIKEGIKIKILIPRSSESQQSNNIITKKYDNIILDQIFYYKTLEYNNIKDSIQWNIFKELTEKKKLKYILFTSPSTIRAFFKIISNNLYNENKNDFGKKFQQFLLEQKNDQEILNCLGIKLIISIGPKTSEELKKREIAYIESTEHTVDGSLKHLFKTIDLA